MPRTADFRVLAGLDLDVLGCPDFAVALAHERKLVAARHALVVVRGGLIAVEVRCRETADQNDGVEHDRFISHVGQPTGQRHWFVVSSCSKVRRRRMRLRLHLRLSKKCNPRPRPEHETEGGGLGRPPLFRCLPALRRLRASLATRRRLDRFPEPSTGSRTGVGLQKR